MNLSLERMNRGRVKAIGVLLLLLVTLAACKESPSGKVTPQAVNGEVNLAGWRFEEDGALKLVGSWQFFHNAFLTPQQVIGGDLPQLRNQLEVPGQWSGFPETSGGKIIPNDSYGTYLLKVTGWPEDLQDIGLELKVDSAYRAYMFDEQATGEITPMSEVGRVGKSTAEEIPQIATRLGRYRPPADAVTKAHYIMIHVSNFHYRTGGLWREPIMDRYQHFETLSQFSLVEETFILGMILIMAIYNFSLTIHRWEDIAALWLGAFCLTMVVRLLSIGAAVPYFFAEPDLTVYIWTRRFENSIVVIGMPILLEFLRANFYRTSPRRFEWVAWGFAAVYSAFIFVADVKTFSATVMVNQLFLAAFSLFLLTRLGMAVHRRQPAAVISACGFAVAFAMAVNDFLISMSILHTPFLMHYGVVALLFSQGQVLAKMFARAFRTAERLTRELKREVEMQTREISSMLNHIPEGIFTIVAPGVIHPRYSDHLSSILGHNDIADKNATDLIFAHSDLNADLLSRVRTTIEATLGEPEIAFALNEGNLVRSFQYTPPDGGESKAIECTWNPILSTNDTVDKILVTLKDVTALRILQNQNLKQQRELEYISEIIGVSAEKFSQFVETSMKFLDENQRLVNQNAARSVEILKIMFINMHTIKGSARTYQFTKMTGVLHEVEQTYSALLKDPSVPWDQNQLSADLARVRELIKTYDDINTQKLGRSNMAGNKLTVERDLLEERVKSLAKIDINMLTIDDQSRIEETVGILNEICFDHANEVIPAMLKTSEKVAKDLGKDPPTIKYYDPGLSINYFGQKVLRDVFTHIIRNSMDHGIEPVPERIEKNKTPEGILSVELQMREEYVVVNYCDDGRGLNMQALLKLGTKMDALPKDREPTLQEIAEVIFASGLSTAASVSEISGRGVGMDAVRRFVQNAGGFVNLVLNQQEAESSAAFIHFKLEIGLPSKYFAHTTKGTGHAA
jgi:hypothetical protein